MAGVVGAVGETYVDAEAHRGEQRGEFQSCRSFSARAKTLCDVLCVPLEQWSELLRNHGARPNGQQWLSLMRVKERTAGQNLLLGAFLGSFGSFDQLPLENRATLASKVRLAEFSPLSLITLQNSVDTEYGQTVGFLIVQVRGSRELLSCTRIKEGSERGAAS